MSLVQLVQPEVLECLGADAREWLGCAFTRFNWRYPSLTEMWSLMDEVWRELDCCSENLDSRVTKFYEHPVWLLNGLFIEQHRESLRNREVFADWVASQRPLRVADYGGGYGSLARMIGERCPEAQVEIIEPHPHLAAQMIADATVNVRYQPELRGRYDILIATDVFEHVPDPLALVLQTAEFLRPGGRFLIANCFKPVILCHLPQTFHFYWTWDAILSRLGLIARERLLYGRIFERVSTLNINKARALEKRSQQLYRLTRYMPVRLARPITRMLVR